MGKDKAERDFVNSGSNKIDPRVMLALGVWKERKGKEAITSDLA
jgi:hypothetical protein